MSERDKLIIRLLADTGIRVGELVALRVDDLVDRDHHQYLKIHGKGARERLVGIPKLKRRLDRYIRGTQELRGQARRVFLTLRRGSDGQLAPVTVRGIQKAVEDAAERAGIHKRVHPHLFRHSYATWAINRGMNPIVLANVLGHSSLTMIHSVYSHQSPSDMYEAMAKLLVED